MFSNDNFDSSKAYNYVLQQCDFGPRYPGSDGHKECKDFLFNKMSEYCDEVNLDKHTIVDPLTSDSVKIYNIFGRINPQNDYRVLLIAHWDTRRFADKDPNKDKRKEPVLGANDGASGVAVLLTLMEQYSGKLKNIGIDILLADAEDMGLYGKADSWAIGSKLFSEKYPDPLPQFAICVDMVADKDLEIKIEKYSYQMAPQLINYLWDLAISKGYYNFKKEIGPGIIDDHLSFSSATQVPSINIIDLDYVYWHTVEDIPENISKESLNIVGEVLMDLLYEVDKKNGK
tara:strand:- start:257 stop:1117 length:861 start_codon:yes stop_codon:yes gene_type:complete